MNKRHYSFVFTFLLFIAFIIIIIISISCSNLIKRRYFAGYYSTMSYSKSIQLNNRNKLLYIRTGNKTSDSSGLKALITIAKRKSDKSSLPLFLITKRDDVFSKIKQKENQSNLKNFYIEKNLYKKKNIDEIKNKRSKIFKSDTNEDSQKGNYWIYLKITIILICKFK